MSNGIFFVPQAYNEPVYDYREGSFEREQIKKVLEKMKNETIEIPLIIGGERIKTGNKGECRCPHDTSVLLGTYHKAGESEVKKAVEASLDAKSKWEAFSWEERASIFLKAAELLAGKYRYILNAATMLGQSKTVHQAEIDSACELIDFYRFNTQFMVDMYEDQPISASGVWNYVEYRPLEGFVFAVTPFNFTSIAGNLPTSPALMGNVVNWKPASSSVYSGYFVYKLLEEAGLPAGVINFVPGDGGTVGNLFLKDPNLSGIHFTGGTSTFQNMWKTIGENIQKYKTYPRIVGETGGKDFIFVHESADPDVLLTAAVRGAFEYQGQKCSAVSRMYIPDNLYKDFKPKLIDTVSNMKMGDIEDFRNFMGAVIDRNSFDNITSYIDHAKSSDDAEIICGGEYDDSKGFFIKPTVIEAKKPDYKSMEEEIFGPVLTIYVYPAGKYEETLDLCNETSPYALTGAIFAQDRAAVVTAKKKLYQSAGNFYINDKPTGAVVGQQPFGGSRASGTNDKAGSLINLYKWVSVRTIKETFVPPSNYEYPYMEAE